MRRNIAPVVFFSLPVLCALALGSCSRGPGRGKEARDHFIRVAQALQAGSLANVYSTALTPSQQADVNALWNEARELVSEDDFRAFQDVLRKASPRLASMLALGSAGTPSLGVLAAKSRDIVTALGLESFEAFRGRDARGILEAIDKGFTADLARAEDIKARLESLRVTVVAEEGDWARLRFAATSPGGGTSEEVADVVASEGSWLPTGWVSDWHATLAALKSEVARLKQEKASSPDLVKQAIGKLGRLLDDPGALLSLLSPPSGGGAPPGS